MSANFTRVEDFEQFAVNTMSKDVNGFYSGGANEEVTLRWNVSAFSNIRIKPKIAKEKNSVKCMKRVILGASTGIPIGAAPSSMQKLVHPDGELATVTACERMEAIMILSTMSTASIEEVALAAPKARKWFQLYVQKDRTVTEGLIRRAERSGYEAIVLTVDLAVQGIRYANMRSGFKLPSHLRLANFEEEQTKSAHDSLCGATSALASYTAAYFDSSLTWKDVTWLKNITGLKIILKGILNPEDATLAVQHGVSGILVSNHGGRQLDTVPASIELLPRIVEAVGGECEVYMDGGIRTGSDVFKAIAFGAKAVFIGRPILWGLCCDGADGVQKIFQILKDELSTAMELTGCVSLDDIVPNTVRLVAGSKL